jgi:hypothetical protein
MRREPVAIGNIWKMTENEKTIKIRKYSDGRVTAVEQWPEQTKVTAEVVEMADPNLLRVILDGTNIGRLEFIFANGWAHYDVLKYDADQQTYSLALAASHWEPEPPA